MAIFVSSSAVLGGQPELDISSIQASDQPWLKLPPLKLSTEVSVAKIKIYYARYNLHYLVIQYEELLRSGTSELKGQNQLLNIFYVHIISQKGDGTTELTKRHLIVCYWDYDIEKKRGIMYRWTLRDLDQDDILDTADFFVFNIFHETVEETNANVWVAENFRSFDVPKAEIKLLNNFYLKARSLLEERIKQNKNFIDKTKKAK